jgi:hypothetical protein
VEGAAVLSRILALAAQAGQAAVGMVAQLLHRQPQGQQIRAAVAVVTKEIITVRLAVPVL